MNWILIVSSIKFRQALQINTTEVISKSNLLRLKLLLYYSFFARLFIFHFDLSIINRFFGSNFISSRFIQRLLTDLLEHCHSIDRGK